MLLQIGDAQVLAVDGVRPGTHGPSGPRFQFRNRGCYKSLTWDDQILLDSTDYPPSTSTDTFIASFHRYVFQEDHQTLKRC